MQPSRLLLRRYGTLRGHQQRAKDRCRPSLGPTLGLRNFSASSSSAPAAAIQPRPSGRSRPSSVKTTPITQIRLRPAATRKHTQRGKTQPEWSESLLSASSSSTNHRSSLSGTAEPRTAQPKATTNNQQQQRRERPSGALHAVRELLLRSRPYGKAQFEAAHKVLDSWKNPLLELSPACVNSAVDLLERLVQEVAAASIDGTAAKNNHHKHHRAAALNHRFMVEPRYYNPVINQWKETAKRCRGKGGVVSPQELWERLQNLARRHPAAAAAAANGFEYNIATLTSIMNVMVALEPDPAEAPVVAEAYFEEIQKQAQQLPSCQPTLWTYATLLKAWAESGRPDASDRMDAVMEHMKEHGLEPNEKVYHIWLRFWAERGDCIDKMEACVAQLQEDGVVQLNMASWSQMVYGYAQARDLEKAAQALERMVEQHNPDDERSVNLLGESIQHIVLACRRAMDNKMIPNKVRDDLLATTQKVMQRYAQVELLGKAHLST